MLLTFLTALRTAAILSTLLTINPATLRIWLILSAAILSITLGLSFTSWFGLILFLIYIGGILVIFSYFVVIQPNQRLEIKPLIITTITTLIILTAVFNYQPKISYPLPSSSRETPPFLLLIPNALIILLILAIILFLALVAAVKITKLQEGPLRPFS